MQRYSLKHASRHLISKRVLMDVNQRNTVKIILNFDRSSGKRNQTAMIEILIIKRREKSNMKIQFNAC